MTGAAPITAENVSKRFRLYHERNQALKISLMRGRRASFEEFWALRDLSFFVQPGEIVGIIGRNGAGKSTLLKIISQITEPTEGSVKLYGRVGSLLEVGTGFHGEPRSELPGGASRAWPA